MVTCIRQTKLCLTNQRYTRERERCTGMQIAIEGGWENVDVRYVNDGGRLITIVHGMGTIFIFMRENY